MSDFDKYAELAKANLPEPEVALVYALLALGGAIDDWRFLLFADGLPVRLEKE